MSGPVARAATHANAHPPVLAPSLQMANQNTPVDSETANLVLLAVCVSRKWDKVVQVLQTLQVRVSKLFGV